MVSQPFILISRIDLTDHDRVGINRQGLFCVVVRHKQVLITRIGISNMHILTDILGYVVLQYPLLLERPY